MNNYKVLREQYVNGEIKWEEYLVALRRLSRRMAIRWVVWFFLAMLPIYLLVLRQIFPSWVILGYSIVSCPAGGAFFGTMMFFVERRKAKVARAALTNS